MHDTCSGGEWPQGPLGTLARPPLQAQGARAGTGSRFRVMGRALAAMEGRAGWSPLSSRL